MYCKGVLKLLHVPACCLQIACCDYHCAAVSSSGVLYTFGSNKLPVGHEVPSSVATADCFLDSDEQTVMSNVRIGYVSLSVA